MGDLFKLMVNGMASLYLFKYETKGLVMDKWGRGKWMGAAQVAECGVATEAGEGVVKRCSR